jgi:hypothetical protein
MVLAFELSQLQVWALVLALALTIFHLGSDAWVRSFGTLGFAYALLLFVLLIAVTPSYLRAARTLRQRSSANDP